MSVRTGGVRPHDVLPGIGHDPFKRLSEIGVNLLWWPLTVNLKK